MLALLILLSIWLLLGVVELEALTMLVVAGLVVY